MSSNNNFSVPQNMMLKANVNVEVEQSVIGVLLIVNNAFAKQAEKLSSDLFTDVRHLAIFDAMLELYEAGVGIDLITVRGQLLKRGKESYIPYMVECSLIISSDKNVEYYIMMLVELATKRDFVRKFNHLVKLAGSGGVDIFDLREKAFADFDSLFIDRFVEANKKDVNFSKLVEDVEYRVEAIMRGEKTGITTSLDVINKAFGGWQKNELTIVAGRPGMGKTAFVVQCAVDLVRKDIPVGIFSLEMSADQIAARIISNHTAISNSSLLRKGFQGSEVDVYLQEKETLQKMPIYIDDTPAISISTLRIKAKSLKNRHNIQVLFLDYLQLISDDKERDNREQEVSYISRSLKALAKELDIPIIALSQLSRRVEQRPDKRPLLSDLRDSGSIEQDADEVIFLYRPEYYGIERWDEEYGGDTTANEAEIIIAKNRQGGILSERCRVDMATSRFFNL